MSKHTPGPWVASEYVGPPFHAGERGSRVDAAAASDYPATRPIAIVHGDNAVWLGVGAAEANARLIAAAPRLLAVAEELIALDLSCHQADDGETSCSDLDCGFCALVQDAKTALKVATP